MARRVEIHCFSRATCSSGSLLFTVAASAGSRKVPPTAPRRLPQHLDVFRRPAPQVLSVWHGVYPRFAAPSASGSGFAAAATHSASAARVFLISVSAPATRGRAASSVSAFCAPRALFCASRRIGRLQPASSCPGPRFERRVHQQPDSGAEGCGVTQDAAVAGDRPPAGRRAAHRLHIPDAPRGRPVDRSPVRRAAVPAHRDGHAAGGVGHHRR